MSKRNKNGNSLASFIPGNNVKLIHGGHPYFDLLEKMIRSAAHIIHFQVYILEEDETGGRIVLALKEAAIRGVKVYLLVDAYGSKKLSSEFIDGIKAAGIHFRLFQPFLKSERFYFGRRLHHKVVVVDNALSLVAGLNIGNRYNDTAEKRAWLDWAVFSEGPASEGLTRICQRRFKQRIHSMDKIHHTPLRIAGLHKDCSVRIRINDWVNNKREISRCYLDMFRKATSHITLMSPYFLPGHDFKRQLKGALARGVKVKVIQAGISDIPVTKYAERYMYDWLLRNKVEIYEYQESVLHGKLGVCDDEWVTVGSYNLNNLSAFVSIELNLEVHDPGFAHGVQHELDTIIKNDCKRITQAGYLRRTNWRARILQRFFYDLSRLALFLFSFYFKQRE